LCGGILDLRQQCAGRVDISNNCAETNYVFDTRNWTRPNLCHHSSSFLNPLWNGRPSFGDREAPTAVVVLQTTVFCDGRNIAGSWSRTAFIRRVAGATFRASVNSIFRVEMCRLPVSLVNTFWSDRAALQVLHGVCFNQVVCAFDAHITPLAFICSRAWQSLGHRVAVCRVRPQR
jgi:hypothetical protein